MISDVERLPTMGQFNFQRIIHIFLNILHTKVFIRKTTIDCHQNCLRTRSSYHKNQILKCYLVGVAPFLSFSWSLEKGILPQKQATKSKHSCPEWTHCCMKCPQILREKTSSQKSHETTVQALASQLHFFF